jgi:chorismate mutase / prephenate dehydrogenase
MGRWFARFLEAQGWGVSLVDPAAPREEDERGRERLGGAELVVVATPPGRTAAAYGEWCEAPPAGVVVDIASIKTPLVEPIRRLQAAGARVASIHPMFGPQAVLLRDADVVICETGDDDATGVVEGLFAPTTAHLVRLPLEEHDRLMADLLSLAHATAIAFALSLPAAEHPVRSTTFKALERLAATVVRESPDVYYEIQAENPHSAVAVAKLRAALGRLTAVLADGDRAAFGELLTEGRRRTPGE